MPVLLLAGVVQVARRSVADIILFFGMAVVVVWDGRRGHAPAPGGHVSPDRRSRRPRTPALLAVALVYSAVTALPGRSSVWVDLAMGGAGAVALALRLRSRPAAEADGSKTETVGPDGLTGDPTGRGWLVWPLLALVLALLELGAFLSQSSPTTDNPDHPTLSTTVEPLLAGEGARALFLLAWTLVGVWLVRAILEENR